MIFNLRVVSADGKHPPAKIIILRNLLRVADLLVFPLLTVLVIPLRQRVGDLAGGAVVVTKDPIPEGEHADPEEL